MSGGTSERAALGLAAGKVPALERTLAETKAYLSWA